MQARTHQILIHGAIGGVIAGTIVVLWFFFLDIMVGQPLATIKTLAGPMVGREISDVSLGVGIAYTAAHYGVFALLGVVAAGTLKAVGTAPGWRHGILYGLGVLNAVYYGALLATGTQMMTVVPAIHVVLANLLGSLAMMSYLHYSWQVEEPLGLAFLKDNHRVTQGVTVGAIGATSVAVWFLVLDVLAGQPFFTPSALGALVFLGASSSVEVGVNLPMIAAYSLVHFGVFFVVGSILIWLSERIEHTPGLWMIAVMGFILVEGVFLSVASVMSWWILGTVGVLATLVGNLIAVGSMGWWIWSTHPLLRERLFEEKMATMV